MNGGGGILSVRHARSQTVRVAANSFGHSNHRASSLIAKRVYTTQRTRIAFIIAPSHASSENGLSECVRGLCVARALIPKLDPRARALQTLMCKRPVTKRNARVVRGTKCANTRRNDVFHVNRTIRTPTRPGFVRVSPSTSSPDVHPCAPAGRQAAIVSAPRGRHRRTRMSVTHMYAPQT